MDLIANLSLGFSTALSMQNVLYAFVGCVLGTLIGVLPGLGPVATIAMLLPATYGLNPTTALIMLAGIFYGAQYGGSTTAILVNLPGESSSVVTAIDGYQMARQGRAGLALFTAGFGSFFAGCVATLVLAAFAPQLAQLAYNFGPADYFSLMTLGLVGAILLASGWVMLGICMIFMGLLLGVVGADVNSGVMRFTFQLPVLFDGIDFVCVAMGLFGFAEVITNLSLKGNREAFTKKVTGMLPTWADFRRMMPAVMRGTVLGSTLGILPGGGAVLSSFSAYTLEKKISKHPEEFGKGAIEGVAGPESANNAASQTSFIPLLTLGIPSNAVMALMVGAMTIHNVQPGPQVMANNPELFWGLIASMWVGNLMLVILNLPLIGVWVRLLTIPYRYLYPAILVFCCIGVYSLNSNVANIYITAIISIFGYVLSKHGCEAAPMLLGFVLGPMMEEYFRRALILSHGSYSIFATSPISLSLLVVTAILITIMALPSVKKKREEAFQED